MIQVFTAIALEASLGAKLDFGCYTAFSGADVFGLIREAEFDPDPESNTFLHE